MNRQAGSPSAKTGRMPVLLPNRHPAFRPAALVLAAVLANIPSRPLDAAVTLNGSDAFATSGAPNGDLTVTGDLSIVKGIDFGTAAAHPALSAAQINYFGPGENAVKFDLTDPAGTLQWRDNLAAAARDKMKLDGGNLLTLYKSDGTGVGIQFNPNTGQINLSGTGSGIYAGDIPVFSIGSGGNLVFGNRPLNLAGTTAAVSSSTGALTVAGGIGVALDSYVNGIRVGRGGGNVTTNTAYGYSALQGNTTGSNNTAAGYDTLQRNTTGYSNTAFGAYALNSGTTGGYNTASGAYSLYCATTGNNNTAAGNYSLFATTTGSGNTAVGNYALGRNLSGASNTALGSYALGTNSTGSCNVAIGSYAGQYQAGGSGLTSSNNSIYIGANARGFSNLDQNAIVIGSGVTGEGANTTVIGNSGTTSTHLYGTVNAGGLTVNHAGGGEALVVDGPTRLKGIVIIEQAQGDISMGIYGP